MNAESCNGLYLTAVFKHKHGYRRKGRTFTINYHSVLQNRLSAELSPVLPSEVIWKTQTLTRERRDRQEGTSVCLVLCCAGADGPNNFKHSCEKLKERRKTHCIRVVVRPPLQGTGSMMTRLCSFCTSNALLTRCW